MACADQFDDESFALQLQLQENEAQRELQSSKWPEDHPPDSVLAIDDFHTELKKAIFLAKYLNFAHRIAKAVDPNTVAFEEPSVKETQSGQDRETTLSLNKDEYLPSREFADLPEIASFEAEHVLRTTEATISSTESNNTVAGPSTTYALREKAILKQFPQLKMEYNICGEAIHPYTTMYLAYNDIYYKLYLKAFFLHITKDESLFPLIYHHQLIYILIIEVDFLVNKLTTY